MLSAIAGSTPMLDVIGELLASLGRKGDAASVTGSANAKLARLLAMYSQVIKYPVGAQAHAVPLAAVPTAYVTYGAYVDLVAAATFNFDGDVIGYEIVPSNTSLYGDFKIAKGGVGAEVDIYFGHWEVDGAAQGAGNKLPVAIGPIPIIGGARLSCAVNSGTNGQGPGLFVWVGKRA